MALLTTNRKQAAKVLHNGGGYAPDTIGNWVATDARDLPWNTIGSALKGSKGKGTEVRGLMSAKQVLKATGLDVTIDMTPLSDPRTGKVIDRLFVTSRTDPKSGDITYFAPVSDKYKVVQPAEALSFFDLVVEGYAGAHYSAAWDMREKSMMGVTIELPETLVVDPQGANDQVGLHLLGLNSYDGSTGLNGTLVATRWFCMNQLAPSFGRNAAPRSFSLRHSSRVLERTKDAQQLIGVARNYMAQLDAVANDLYAERMSDAEFHRFVQEFPTFSTNGLEGLKLARALERQAEAVEAWEAPHNANIRGTRWGALNIVAEWAEWGRNVRGSHRTGADATRQRAIGTLTHTNVTSPVTAAMEMLLAA